MREQPSVEQERRITETLQALPRVHAKQDFTAGVLERLETTAPASPWGFSRIWVPVLATAMLVLAVVWQGHRERSEERRLAGQARIEALRSERQSLEAELDTLRRLARSSRPVLYLGADQGVDLVYDLSRLKQGDRVEIPSYLQDAQQLTSLEEKVPLATWPWVASQGRAAPGMTSSGRGEESRSSPKGQSVPAAARTLY